LPGYWRKVASTVAKPFCLCILNYDLKTSKMDAVDFRYFANDILKTLSELSVDNRCYTGIYQLIQNTRNWSWCDVV
jgi:hypothetical protein